MATEAELLGEQIAEQAAHLDAATHRLLTDLRAFDASGEWYRQGARSCAHWLSWRIGWGGGKAREHVRVARRLGELPRIDEALRRGELSYCKVRAITRVATSANEAELLEQARHATGADLERICRKYAMVVRAATATEHDERSRRTVWRRDLEDGMVRIEVTLHAEEAAIVWAAIEKVARERGTSAASAEPQAPASTDHHAHTVPGSATLDAAGPRPSSATRPHANDSGTVVDALGMSPSGSMMDGSMMDGSMMDGSPLPGCYAEGGTSGEENGTAGGIAAGGESGAAGGAANGGQNDLEKVPMQRQCDARTDARRRQEPAEPRRRERAAFDRADALLAIAQEILRGTSPNRAPTELVVTVSAETLLAPHTAPEPIAAIADGTCVSAETARRLACDCGVVYMHEDAAGHVLSVGRKTRTIPVSIKRALLRRDRTCRFPGCDNRLFLEGHHIEHWAAGGETSLDNLVGVCGHHHRFLHEYGYQVHMDEAGHPVFLDPRGRPVRDVPPRPAPPHLGWPAIELANQWLGITPRTGECLWDGRPVDYVTAIDELVRLDELT